MFHEYFYQMVYWTWSSTQPPMVERETGIVDSALSISSITRRPVMQRESSPPLRYDRNIIWFFSNEEAKILYNNYIEYIYLQGPRPFNHELVVDWAEQQEEPSEEEMNKVKSCYVRNLKEAYTEEMIKERSFIYLLIVVHDISLFGYYHISLIANENIADSRSMVRWRGWRKLKNTLSSISRRERIALR